MPPDKERDRSSSSSSSSSADERPEQTTGADEQTTSVLQNSGTSARGVVFGQPDQTQEQQASDTLDTLDAADMSLRGQDSGPTLVAPATTLPPSFDGEWATYVDQKEESFTSGSPVWLQAVVDAALADVHKTRQVQRRAQATVEQAERVTALLQRRMAQFGNPGTTSSSGSDTD